jgi:hypothetical protein
LLSDPTLPEVCLELHEHRQTPVKNKLSAVAIVIFYDVMPGIPVACYQRFETTFRLHIHQCRSWY